MAQVYFPDYSLPGNTRQSISSFEHRETSGITEAFYKAYQAMYKDAILLMQRCDNDFDLRGDSKLQTEFDQFLLLMHDIIEWALTTLDTRPEQHTNREELRKSIASLNKEIEKTRVARGKPSAGEAKLIPADTCLCILARLLARCNLTEPIDPESTAAEIEYCKLLQQLNISREMRSLDDGLKTAFMPKKLSVCIQRKEDETHQLVMASSYESTAEKTTLSSWATDTWHRRFEATPAGKEVVSNTGNVRELLWVTEQSPQYFVGPHKRTPDPVFHLNFLELSKILAANQKIKIFDHRLDILATFDEHQDWELCSRCAKCKVMFAFSVGKKAAVKELDLSSFKYMWGNTCAEGLLHCQCLQANPVAPAARVAPAEAPVLEVAPKALKRCSLKLLVHKVRKTSKWPPRRSRRTLEVTLPEPAA